MLNTCITKLLEMEKQNVEKVSIGYILAAYFFHSLQITCYKCGHFKIVAQAMYFRSFFTVIILFFGQYKQEFYPKGKVFIIFFSQLLVALGAALLFYGINYTTMSEAIVINSTTAVWSQLITLIITRQPISGSRFFNSFICILGIALIVNPKFSGENDVQRIVACLGILVCSIIQATGFIMMRSIGKEVRPTIITFYFHLTVIFVMTIQHQYIADFEYFNGYFYFIAGYTLFSLIGHLMQFRAQSLVAYDKICNYPYSQMIYQMILDYLIFGKVTSQLGFFGGAMILFGVFKQLREDRK